MKIFCLFVLASLLLVNTVTSQESPELKEAATLTESVVKLFNERKFDEALPAAKRALEIRERLLTVGDPRISTSLSYLADIYTARRDYGAARKLLLRLLQNEERRVGPENIGLASTLDRVALLHRREGNYRDAEAAYTRAIALKEKAFGTDHVDVAQSLVGLAELFRDHQKFDQAAPIYRRALLIYAKYLGLNSVQFSQASEAYVCLGFETNKRDETKDLIDIRKRFAVPGSLDDPPEGTILNGRALELGRPEYPPQAVASKIEGSVMVKVEIDEAGRVISAYDMCQAQPTLSEAAVKAALKSRFSPTKILGKPVKVSGIIEYHFRRH